MYCLNFSCCFSTRILLDLRTGLLITGILLGEYRNFFLPLDSTDSLLTKLSLVMLFSLRTRECRNNFCTNLSYLLYLCQYLIIPKDNINSGTEQKLKKIHGKPNLILIWTVGFSILNILFKILYGNSWYRCLGRLGVASELSPWTGIHGWTTGDSSYCWDPEWHI